MKLKSLIRFLSVLVTCVLEIGCSTPRSSGITPLNDTRPIAITHVNILPMTGRDTVLYNASIVVQDRKIVSINGAIPANARVIDAKGKWLMPGLIDMHVHNLADISFSKPYPTKGATLYADTEDFMLLFVANGVTTVFELSGRVEHFGQRNEIIKGLVVGPRVTLAILVEGGVGEGNRANTAEEGRQTVRLAKSQGYEFIKVYSGLNIETFKAIIDEARLQDMKVIGHIPNAFKGRLSEAFVPHFGLVAHAEEYGKHTDSFTVADAKRYAQLAKANNTWLNPTLITMVKILDQARSIDSVIQLPTLKYVHPLMRSKWIGSNNYNRGTGPERVAIFDKFVRFNSLLVREFKAAGVPIVAGTDAGVSAVVWGFAMHDELALLVQAGLTPGEALDAATRLPAEWLGISDKVGTIEAGKLADLLLLDRNPLDDIENTRAIASVMVNGRWIERSWIDAKLDALEKKNEANRNTFDWKKRSEF